MHQYWSCICLCLWNVLRARNRRPISMPFTKVSNQLRVISQVCPVNKYRWVKFCLLREEASCWICSTMFQSRLSYQLPICSLICACLWLECRVWAPSRSTSNQWPLLSSSLSEGESQQANQWFYSMTLWLCVYYTTPNLSSKPYNRLMHTSASGVEQLKAPISSWGC